MLSSEKLTLRLKETMAKTLVHFNEEENSPQVYRKAGSAHLNSLAAL